MLILNSDNWCVDKISNPISPLNALWIGAVRQSETLPQMGHLFLVFPLASATVGCAETPIDPAHYLFLTKRAEERPYLIQNLHSEQCAKVLLLCLSPDFITDMAGFLNIPAELSDLLHAIPLLQGDALSHLLAYLADAASNDPEPEELEDIFFEIVGQVLQLMRLRHKALLSLAVHKQNTVDDLLPRLLQARQIIEAQFLKPIKTVDLANHVALSEYHFARLFKAAFDMTVHQYVMQLRLNKSRHLLEEPEASVTEIALEVGYNSLSAFINAFRRQFGVSPTHYRANFLV